MPSSTPGLTVLSAMITPAVLILATGSLLMTTSQRLSRSMERARKLASEIEQIDAKSSRLDRRQMFYDQLIVASRRAHLLQYAMFCLYLAQGAFVATSLTIGLIELTHVSFAWIPVCCGFAGALLLLGASVMLIVESRFALGAITREMAALKECSYRDGDSNVAHNGALDSGTS